MSVATAVLMKVTQANHSRLLRTAAWQLSPEARAHSGANPQIVLPVVETI
jgi:hypothetical protein